MSDIEKRISKLEKQGFGKVFLQYILSPLLIVAVGAILNYRVDQNKEELHRLEIAEDMVTNMFDDESYFKTLATLKIMKNVLDEELYLELKTIIENYYNKLREESVVEAEKILTAAELVGGEEVNEMVQAIKSDSEVFEEIENYRDARKLQEEAIEDLLKGNIDIAIKKLDSTGQISSEFQQTPEIAKFVEAKRDSLEDPNTRRQIYQQIAVDFDFELQKKAINNLKKQAIKD